VAGGIFTSDSPTHPLALDTGLMTSRIFLTAMELNVFGTLGDRRLTSREMAERMGTDPRATEILLNALVAMGLMEKDGDAFANVEDLAEPSPPGCPDYGNRFRYAVHLWEAFAHLTEIVKSGRPFVPQPTDERRRDFALHMMRYAREGAEALLSTVGFSDVRNLLDLGGGTGTYTIAVARQYPQIKAVLFERDAQALQLARGEIARAGLRDRIRVKRGDFLVDDFGKGYDLVLLCSILCLFGEEQNLSLLRRIYESLATGGRVVIRDPITDRSHTRPRAAAIFAVKLLVATPSGGCYSCAEIERWLRSTGFNGLRRIPAGRAQVIIARKGKPSGPDAREGQP